jgi:hypothetical protein
MGSKNDFRDAQALPGGTRPWRQEGKVIRTFTGQLDGLDVGTSFVVITISESSSPDVPTRKIFTVLRRDEHYVVAGERETDMPHFETHTSRNGAPLFRVNRPCDDPASACASSLSPPQLAD